MFCMGEAPPCKNEPARSRSSRLSVRVKELTATPPPAEPGRPGRPVALGLGGGGSARNPPDRVRLGSVTDFLDLRYWPAFNLADSFIVIGVGILLTTLLAGEREPRRARHVRDAAARP